VSSLGFVNVIGDYLSSLSVLLLLFYAPILEFERYNEPLDFIGASSIALLGFVYSGECLPRADIGLAAEPRFDNCPPCAEPYPLAPGRLRTEGSARAFLPLYPYLRLFFLRSSSVR